MKPSTCPECLCRLDSTEPNEDGVYALLCCNPYCDFRTFREIPPKEERDEPLDENLLNYIWHLLNGSPFDIRNEAWEDIDESVQTWFYSLSIKERFDLFKKVKEER